MKSEWEDTLQHQNNLLKITTAEMFRVLELSHILHHLFFPHLSESSNEDLISNAAKQIWFFLKTLFA